MQTFLPSIIFLLILMVLDTQASTIMSSSCPDNSQTPSLHHQYCCAVPNIGRSFKIREGNHASLIFCPKSLPQSCKYQSCRELQEKLLITTSGYYNITQSNGRTVSVYCDMEGSNCDGNGGWMRVGYINMTQPHATCPEGLYKYTLGSLALYVIDKIFLVKDVIPHSFHPTDCNI